MWVLGIKLRLAGSVANVYSSNHLASQGLVLMAKCFKIVIKVVRTYLGHQNEVYLTVLVITTQGLYISSFCP